MIRNNLSQTKKKKSTFSLISYIFYFYQVFVSIHVSNIYFLHFNKRIERRFDFESWKSTKIFFKNITTTNFCSKSTLKKSMLKKIVAKNCCLRTTTKKKFSTRRRHWKDRCWKKQLQKTAVCERRQKKIDCWKLSIDDDNNESFSFDDDVKKRIDFCRKLRFDDNDKKNSTIVENFIFRRFDIKINRWIISLYFFINSNVFFNFEIFFYSFHSNFQFFYLIKYFKLRRTICFLLINFFIFYNCTRFVFFSTKTKSK